MSDAEVICEWMETKPSAVPDNAEDMELCGSSLGTPLRFWICAGGYDVPYSWLPSTLTLDRLHLVEERLTDEQWDRYRKYLCPVSLNSWQLTVHRCLIHATAEQKIKALAEVLREVRYE